jgi:hypothetical protein
MKILQAILGMLAVLLVSAQTFRHIFVRWIEPRHSELDRFRESTETSIAKSNSLSELVDLYEISWKQVREEDAKHPDTEDNHDTWERRQKDPYRSEAQLKAAIQQWEQHQRQLYELHFFWWSGCLAVALGLLAYARFSRWLGLSAFVLGYLEMTYATCPALREFGSAAEFDRLLTYKVVYSTITLLLVLGLWRLLAVTQGRAAEPAFSPSSDRSPSRA